MMIKTIFGNEDKNVIKKLHKGDDVQADVGKNIFKIRKTRSIEAY